MQVSKLRVVLILRHVFRQESYSYERHYRVCYSYTYAGLGWSSVKQRAENDDSAQIYFRATSDYDFWPGYQQIAQVHSLY